LENEFKKVESSNLNAVKYDKEKEELTVEFKGGSQYLYLKVPVHTFDSFIVAESKGKFFHKEIKGKFENVKIKSAPKKEEEENVRTGKPGIKLQRRRQSR